jgi:hypothetical protein
MAALTTRCTDPKGSSCVTRGIYTCRKLLFQSFRYSVGATVGEEAVFKGRQFDRSVILLCLQRYLAYNLSLRNLGEMMTECGISVDHATVHR